MTNSNRKWYSLGKYLVVLLAVSMAAVSCQDSPLSSKQDKDSAGINSVLGESGAGTVENVFISNDQTDTWDPIFPSSADPNWPSTVCYQDNTFGLNANWVNPHKAFALAATHPWESNAGYDWDAEWINSYNDIASRGPGGHNWSRYEKEVSGEGQFVVQLLADNCSWIYLDGSLIGFQDVGDENDPTKGKYGVTLDGNHTLTFVIFDGGGAAGGKFRLETSESFGGEVDPIETTNNAPVADAGNAQTVEATGSLTSVSLDGSGSNDEDGDALSYSWSLNGGVIATGATPSVDLGLGSHTITLTVDDGNGGSDTDDVVVTVEDTTPAELAYSVGNTELWPPNHKMRLVVSGITASDLVDDNPQLSVVVTSNEATNGRGDGNTDSDWNVIDNGDGTFDVEVRAERDGRESGRTYTITMTATDASGNTITETVTATVPNNKGKGGGKGRNR